jgi:L-tartrate/succinate antiporter
MSKIEKPIKPVVPVQETPHAIEWWRIALPFAVLLAIGLIPAPNGLGQHAWYYFAIFAAIISALVVEPLPNPAVGIIGVTVVTVLSGWVLFSPEEMAQPGFKLTSAAIDWALAGFASSTVWLVGGAFMFALGYAKTGLGRRIALLLVHLLGRNTLLIGYATTLADAILAPFTPSNTARSAGTIFPVVVNLPPIYGSLPHDPSSRKIGGYVMWTTLAASSVTSSLFMTACAPNLLALEFIKKIVHVDITYQQWMMASLPWALPLLLALPLLAYLFYPPEIKRSTEVPVWAHREVVKMGPISRKEITLGVFVLMAIVMWVFGEKYVDPATAAFIVMSLMLIFRVVTWKDMANHQAAWTTIVLLATLVTLADGLGKTGFIKWFGALVAAHVVGFSPIVVILVLVSVYFFAHYMFASLTAHTSAMMPVMLAVGIGIPGVPADKLALALAMTTGIMGVLTPYATGAALPYYNSGYLPPAEFWRLGAIFGVIFLGALLLIGVPVLMAW